MAKFGFAIAALFRTLMAQSPNPQTAPLHEGAIWFGLALVVLGIVATVLAGISHWLAVRRLRRNEALVLFSRTGGARLLKLGFGKAALA